MKKLLAYLIIILLVMSSVPTMAEEKIPTPPEYNYNELNVGSTTRLSGNFFSDIFGNNTADLDVQFLLHGYNLIEWNTTMGGFSVNESVVSGISVTENDFGDRTYTLALYDDLYFSDGTQITAKDYAFSIMLSASPELAEIGAARSGSEGILGMTEYANGITGRLIGVRVKGDLLLSVTIKHEYRPFFYEMGLLNYVPYPISVIAPGCRVRDDGDGVSIEPRERFTAELLKQTVLDPETGYLGHPSVVSGPYTFVSFDGTTAEFAINPYYKGNSKNLLPQIATLRYTLTTNDTMIDDLNSGKLGLVNKVVNGDVIKAGIENLNGGYFGMNSYTRSGLSYINFCCEKKAVSSAAVRKAIASCLDKDAIVAAYVGDYGLRTDGYYGLGQWMYQFVSGAVPPPIMAEPSDDSDTAETRTGTETETTGETVTTYETETTIQTEMTVSTTVTAQNETVLSTDGMTYEEELAAWDALNLDALTMYEFDPAVGQQGLVEDGWTLNENGNPYMAGTDEVRCALIDGELVPLDLTLAYPEGNSIAGLLQTSLVEPLSQIGIKVTLMPVEMTQLLKWHYRLEERDCDMIYLATNFNFVFDPSLTYSTEEYSRSVYNTSSIRDQELYELAVDMRKTEPGDLLGYCRKWIAFQERWTEILPAVPIYTNAYFDFYTNCLHDYFINESITWTQAVVGAYMSDIDAPAAESEGDIFFD